MRVQLNRFTPAKSYRSRTELIEETKRQYERFAELRHSKSAAHQQWGNSLASWWSSAHQIASDYSIADEDISNRIKATPCVPFDSPVVERLLWLTNNDMPNRAEGGRSYLDPRHDGNNANRGVLAGAADIASVIAVQNRLGPSSTKKMVVDLIDQMEQRLDPILEQDAKELEAKREEFSVAKEEMEQAVEKLRVDAAELLASSKSQWDKAYDDFVNQLKTQTAVELWEERSADHTKRFKTFRTASGATALFGGFASFSWIFNGYQFAISSFPNNGNAQLAAFAAGSLLLFTLLIWTLRVLVRSMISEDHLATDASARSAMAHTYLALAKEDKASPEDRAIILASLFAPVSDGLVKDDGMPLLSPAALAAASITNPKSN